MPIIENEFRVIGPPGCGKTTYLSGQVKARVDRWCGDTGLPPSDCTDVLVSSLTKAAAAEVVGRGLAIDPKQIGTLHSHCARALGSPKMCVGAKQIGEWNKQASMDHWLSGGASNREEDGFEIGVGKYRGDALHTEYTINRCRLTPRETWSDEVEEFAKAYERWKFLNSYLDYADLIDQAFKDKVAPPGNPSTILVDECQDHDRLELRLLRYWASRVNKLIIVGDPDQNLYEWRGSDPGGFYESDIPEGQTKVLEQSYRVPAAVHEAAMEMIGRCNERRPVVYHPTKEPGEVERACWSPRRHPEMCVREIDELLQEPDSKPGRPKVMVLFSCAYMANPLLSMLRAEGIPYWNPYSRDRGNFNPLHPAKGMSTLDRVLAFLKPNTDCYGDQAKLWTWSDFHSWVEICTADGWLRHGAKKFIERQASDRPTETMSVDDLDGVLSSPDVLAELADVKLEWLGSHIMEAKANAYQFAVDIATRKGYNGILTNPRVVVGTIHSVKGAEADHVILCPDLSSSGWEVYGSKHIDSLHRLYYVGLTRAFRRLVLCSPSCPQAIQW
jgi:DNA helicase-2/ATP-dependent DNA helicase PcrA